MDYTIQFRPAGKPISETAHIDLLGLAVGNSLFSVTWSIFT